MSGDEKALIDWNSSGAFRNLLDWLPVPLLLLDEMGRICWTNQAWTDSAAVVDLDSDAGRDRCTQLHFDHQELQRLARNFLAGHQPQADVFLAVSQERHSRTVGLRLYRTAGPAAALIAIADHPDAASADITATIETVLPWLLLDGEGRITACSPILQARLPLPPGGLAGTSPAGTSIAEILHPDDRASCRQKLMDSCRSDGPLAKLPMRIVTRDGGLVMCEAHPFPVQDASGRRCGLRLALFDVTERERAQKALEESRDLYRTLAESCGAGVWHVTPQGQTLYANPVMCAMLEVDSLEELTRHALHEFFPPASQERIRAEEQQREAGQVSHYEVEMIGKRGTRRHVQITGATLPDGDYRFSGFLGTFIDITASQKRELELRQTQKMEAVGRLAAGIAHEINTPIQFAGDSIQFLRDALQEMEMLLSRYREALGSDPSALAQQREQLQSLEQEIDFDYLQEQMPKAIDRSIEGLNRVAAIVRAMKTFANPDDGRKGHVDLNQALLNTLTIARNEYKYVADVVTDFGELPPVICSLSELNQVFLNLLVNAAQSIGEKARQQPNFRGVIHVTTRTDGDHIAVTISDTGAGIPASIRHKIFDPFFTTKPVGSGTGQGLTVAHSVVERHGGTIHFTTEEGEGAIFTVKLPIHGIARPSTEEARA